MSENQKQNDGQVETTGHAWDGGDLQEYNTPLPRWWLWAFYATVVFAVIYWILYPAWPIGDTYTKGISTITYEVDGEERTSHWNTRARLMRDMQESPAAVRQQEFLDQVSGMEYEDVAADPDLMAFARSYGAGLFGDNCAACHQTGGGGVIGLYPNLVDGEWYWGGDYETIETTLRNGRAGFMQAFDDTLSDEEIHQVSSYVLSLSGHDVDEAAAAEGDEIFNGSVGGCFACHGEGGTGQQALGAPNLTTEIWSIPDVHGRDTIEGKLEEIEQVVRRGVNTADGFQREMPAFGERLSEEEIRMLTLYVRDLGGSL